MPAPVFTNLTSNGGSSATSFTTASISPTGSRLILVSVHAYISTGSAQPATPTVTGNGITYALVKSQNVDTAGTDRATLFVFRGMASSPTTGAITISFGATTMTRCEWSVDQSDANVNTQGTNGDKAIRTANITGVTLGSTATSASVNFPNTMESKNTCFSAWGHQVNEQKTPRSGWTELADNFAVTFCSMETQYKAGTDTAGSANWTSASLAGGILLEIVGPPVLLASYDYNEASGNVLDGSGNGLNYALTGTSTRTAAGGGYTYGGTRPNNQGLTQTSAQVQQGPSTTTLKPPRITVMTWAKAGAANPSWFLEWHDTAGSTGVLGWLTLASFTGRMKETPSNTAHDITLTPDGTNWHHWALTYDGTNFSAYKDGTLVSSVASTAMAASDTLYVFDNAGSGCVLSDTRIYDDALDATTIAALKDTPLTAGGTTLVLGAATETDAAYSISYARSVTLSVATETDTARSVTLARTVVLSTATEADSSYSVVEAKSLTVSRATETDTALGLVEARTVSLGTAAETDTAFVLSAAEAVSFSLGVATEIDAALALSATRALTSTLGTATETDQAQSLAQTKVATLGTATETDEAFFLTTNGQATFTFDRAQETDAGLSLTSVKLIELGVATEVEASYALSAAGAVTITLGTATELDSAKEILTPGSSRDITIEALGDPGNAWAVTDLALQTVVTAGPVQNPAWSTTAPISEWVADGPESGAWAVSDPEL